MKNFTYIFIFLITSAGFSQVVLDFEGAAPGFGDFNGSATQLIVNPDPTGVNTTANVAENVVAANAAFAGVNIVAPIDLTVNKVLRMDVWSPLAGIPVLLKLEGGPNPPIERQANLTTTGAWEEIVFDFSSEGAVTYDSVTVFMNFNMIDAAAQTYYWDNLELFTPAPAAPSLPITFEGGQLPAFGDFGGSATQVISNPDATGVNTSANVAENMIPANAAFAGVNYPVGLIDLSTDKGFTMNVWSPLVNTPVLLKLESSTGLPQERLVNLTTTGAWEEIAFDFSALTNETFDSVTVFMNFNQVDAVAQTYYWDNLTQVSLAPAAPSLPITFEGGQLPAFGDFGGSATQVISNPDATGVNTSANVAENMIPANAAFAGVNYPVGLIDLSTDKGFTMNVWSPLVNTPVLLKLESSTGLPQERLVNLTTTGAWEEIAFDFSALTNETFDSVTIFMNFNQVDAGAQTYYWDNLTQVSLAPAAPSLPITFEGGQLPAFGDFGGSATQVISNPDATGVNTSANVAENMIPANAAFAGVNYPVGLIDLSTDKGFTMNVWSPLVNTPVLLKLESSTGLPQERLVNLTTTGAWEEIAFDFSALTNETFDSVTVFMNFNQVDAVAQTYYWDNLTQVSLAPAAPVFPLTFEDSGIDYAPIGFEGADSVVEANAVSGGINTSAMVLRTTKTDGAQFFAGTAINLDAPIDFSSSEMITMKSYSPKAGIPVKMRLENADNSVGAEVDVNTTLVDGWEVLTFDFTGQSAAADYVRLVVFYEFVEGLPGDGSTYYFDDVEVMTPMSSGPVFPLTFEDSGIDYAPIGFEGADSVVEANAVSGGINTSAMVLRTTKTDGAQFFAGTAINLDAPIDFSSSEMITMKSYSPKAGIPVKMRLENADNSVGAEVDVNTTLVDGWEVLTFDFTGQSAAADYVRLVVFYEFVEGLPGDGSTYYFDDVEVMTPMSSGPVFPLTFEDSGIDYAPIGFEGADSVVEANAVSGGINTSAMVLRTTKTDGAQFFAGTAINLDVPIDFSSSEMITMKSYSPKAGIPVKMRLENADNSVGAEVDVNTTLVDGWEVLTFDFTGQSAAADYVRLVVFYEFVEGLPGDGSTYYFDDVEVMTPMSSGPVFPLTFEDSGIDYAPIGFEGADSVVEANAVSGGINTSAMVLRTTKTDGAQFFAGTAINLDAPIDFSSSEMITMKSYSPKAGIPVKIRLENADNSVGAEVDVNTTLVDGWEVLTFDFTGQSAAADYVRLVVFYEFVEGLPGDGSTYYFDDVEVAPAPMGDPVVLPITFEDTDVDYNPIGFEGADSVVEANAVAGGINTSATVLRTTKTDGAQFFAGTAINLGTPIDFSEFEGISMKTYSPKAGIPVKMRLENADNSVGIEVDVNTTVTDEWETLLYDFTGMTAGTDFVRIVVFFEFIDGLPGDGSTYYFDDVMVTNPLSVQGVELTSVAVYPNPTIDQLNIAAQVAIANISVVNMLGQEVFASQPKATNTQLTLGYLNTGIYLVHISDDFGNVKTVKIVKK